eukprot:gene31860-39360_t
MQFMNDQRQFIMKMWAVCVVKNEKIPSYNAGNSCEADSTDRIYIQCAMIIGPIKYVAPAGGNVKKAAKSHHQSAVKVENSAFSRWGSESSYEESEEYESYEEDE